MQLESSGMKPEKAIAYFEALRLLNEFSAELGVTPYIFGGFTLDIWAGEFLRDHGDIDVLTENFLLYVSQFSNMFIGNGYEVRQLENGDLKIVKGEIKIHIGNIIVREDLVEWTHNGTKGSILFPPEWLIQTAYNFFGIQVYTVSAEFEYVLKMHPELMNPQWQPREKDMQARQRLSEILAVRYRDLAVLRSRVTSH